MLYFFVLLFVRGAEIYFDSQIWGTCEKNTYDIHKVLYRGQQLRVKWRGIFVVILLQDAGGIRGTPAVGVPSIETLGVHCACDSGAMLPECKGGVFREFGVRKWRVFEFVEEAKDMNINIDCVQCPQFVGKVGAMERWMVELIQKFEARVATEARSQDLAKPRRDILDKGCEKKLRR
jgi:hypothetical protein